MKNESIIFSKKDFYKLIIMIILASLLFGAVGVVIILLFQLVTEKTYTAENGKHGISKMSSSRFGGLALFISTLGILLIGFLNDEVIGTLGKPLTDNLFTWIGVLGCSFLGLVEDFKNDSLSPKSRLTFKFILFGFIIGYWPFLVPTDLGIFMLEDILSVSILGWFLTVIFCVGFVNSVNMADGANGLISGTMTIVFAVFYLETGNFGHAAIMSACALFTLFNVISGRLFLGDTGSYGLGAAAALGGLFLFSSEVFSAAFLACLFAYPCIDFLVTLVRRKLKNSSLMKPDNNHFHNLVHKYFEQVFSSKTLSNSATGLIVVGLSSGLTFVAYLMDLWSVKSSAWLWLFCFQAFLYAILFYCAGYSNRGVEIGKHDK